MIALQHSLVFIHCEVIINNSINLKFLKSSLLKSIHLLTSSHFLPEENYRRIINSLLCYAISRTLKTHFQHLSVVTLP